MIIYDAKNHCKYHLRYHIIFVCKYRRKILVDNGRAIKLSLLIVAKRIGIKILVLEVDRDHVHLLISAPPNISPLKITKQLKQSSGYYAKHNINLRKYNCKNKLWSAGCFICSIGDASEATIKKYIESQGRHQRSISSLS